MKKLPVKCSPLERVEAIRCLYISYLILEQRERKREMNLLAGEIRNQIAFLEHELEQVGI